MQFQLTTLQFFYARFAVLIMPTIVVLYYLNTNYTKLFYNVTDGDKDVKWKVHNSTKLILLWRPLYKHVNTFTEAFKKHCPELKMECSVSVNRRLLHKADAVLVEVQGIQNLPKKRKMGQIWIYVDLEAPSYRRNGLKKWNNLFNWTLSYRRDSNFLTNYGVIPDMRLASRTLEESMMNKTKQMSWIVSHCTTAGKREEYVKILQKYFSVDIFGRCGKKICKSGCEKDYIKDYKFFFAAENSNCRDYITEKVYRALPLATLPVVKGRLNYSLYMPPKSVIDANDFSSPMTLAEYLMTVSNNHELYKSYFTWHKRRDVNRGVPGYNAYCEICRRLHNQSEYRRLYRSIHDWWRGNDENVGEYFCRKEELVKL